MISSSVKSPVALRIYSICCIIHASAFRKSAFWLESYDAWSYESSTGSSIPNSCFLRFSTSICCSEFIHTVNNACGYILLNVHNKPIHYLLTATAYYFVYSGCAITVLCLLLVFLPTTVMYISCCFIIILKGCLLRLKRFFKNPYKCLWAPNLSFKYSSLFKWLLIYFTWSYSSKKCFRFLLT